MIWGRVKADQYENIYSPSKDVHVIVLKKLVTLLLKDRVKSHEMDWLLKLIVSNHNVFFTCCSMHPQRKSKQSYEWKSQLLLLLEHIQCLHCHRHFLHCCGHFLHCHRYFLQCRGHFHCRRHVHFSHSCGIYVITWNHFIYKVTTWCLRTISQNIIYRSKIFLKSHNNLAPSVADRAQKWLHLVGFDTLRISIDIA